MDDLEQQIEDLERGIYPPYYDDKPKPPPATTPAVPWMPFSEIIPMRDPIRPMC